MSPELAVFIMMNNYFHDVATAMLFASGVAMWLILKNLENKTEDAIKYLFIIYQSVTLLAKISLYWILVGGVPRILTYKSFELANAVEKNQVPGLIVKHIIASIFVGSGVYVWLRLSSKIKEIKEGTRN